MAGSVAGVGDEKWVRNLNWKSETKRPIARPRCRWVAMLKWILETLGIEVLAGLS